MAKQIKIPVSRKNIPAPSRIWRLRSALNGATLLTGGGGVVFLFLVVVAILGECGIEIQYYKSIIKKPKTLFSIWIKFIFPYHCETFYKINIFRPQINLLPQTNVFIIFNVFLY